MYCIDKLHSRKANYFLFCCIYSFIADAEIMDDILNYDTPQIMSASRFNQTILQAPSAVTIIDKYMIEATGFNEFVDVLRLVPGFQVGHFNSRLHIAVYHGLGWEFSNHMQILVDGRSTYNDSLASIDWNAIGVQLEDVDRIEIVRGPAASAYGSNSFTSAINITTQSFPRNNKLLIKSHISSHGDERLLLKLNDAYKSSAYNLTAVYRNDPGEKVKNGSYAYSDERDIKEITLRNSFSKNNHNFKSVVSLNNINSGAFPIPQLEIKPRFQKDKSVHLKWGYQVDYNQEWGADFSFYSKRSDDVRPTKPLTQLPLPQPVLSYLYTLDDPRVEVGYENYLIHKTDAEIQYNRIKNSNKLSMGLGARYVAMKSDTYLKHKGEVSEFTSRLFINNQHNLSEDLFVNFGCIYEYSNLNKNTWSPRLSLNWQQLKNHSFRLGYSEAYRKPTVLERYLQNKISLSNGILLDYNSDYDKNIKPAKITSIDASYIGTMINNSISWEFKIFAEDLQNYIYFSPYRDSTIGDINNSYSVVTNIGEYKTYGIEGSITYRPSLKHILRFHFLRGHSKAHFIDNLKTRSSSTFTEYMPRESYGVIFSRTLTEWDISTGIYQTGQMEWAGKGEAVPAYTRYDFTVGRSFQLNKNVLNIKLVAQRIGGSYQEFNDEFSYDKELFFQVKWLH